MTDIAKFYNKFLSLNRTGPKQYSRVATLNCRLGDKDTRSRSAMQHRHGLTDTML